MDEKPSRILGPNVQLAYLKSKEINAEIVWLPAGQAKTSALAARTVECDLAQIAKNIVVAGNSHLYLVTLSSDMKGDLEKVSRVVGEKVSLASPREVLERLGYPVGGVPPFAHLEPIRIIVDSSVIRFTEVFTSGGSKDALTRIDVSELLKHTGAQVEEVSK
jgi:prolyl-tRNA editing enzyme YbaK/EbsC (Cys-tRNA(Pro) deacylase)